MSLILIFAYLAGFAIIANSPSLAATRSQDGKPSHQGRSKFPDKHFPLPENILDGYFKRATSSKGKPIFKDTSGHFYHLTIDTALQRKAESIFERYNPKYGALVALEPNSGKILALVSHSSKKKGKGNLGLKASFPAASIFKLITLAAALEDERPVSPNLLLPYWGSPYDLSREKLFGRPKAEVRQSTLTEALGNSNNVVFGKLAINYVGANNLQRYADAFGFNRPIDFDLSVEPSSAKVPGEPFELAKIASGLGEATMSPIHGALISAAIANDGDMMSPYIVEKVTNSKGEVLYRNSEAILLTPITQNTAAQIKKMMVETITNGTSKKAFHDNRGRPALPEITIAGKTGSIRGDNPKGKYSWFVGFAPVDEPQIVVSALVINGAKAKLKSSYLAREVFQAFFASLNNRR